MSEKEYIPAIDEESLDGIDTSELIEHVICSFEGATCVGKKHIINSSLRAGKAPLLDERFKQWNKASRGIINDMLKAQKKLYSTPQTEVGIAVVAVINALQEVIKYKRNCHLIERPMDMAHEVIQEYHDAIEILEQKLFGENHRQSKMDDVLRRVVNLEKELR